MSDRIKVTVLLLDPDSDFLIAARDANKDPSINVISETFGARNKAKLPELIQTHYPDIVVVNLDVDDELDFGSPITEIQNIPLSLCPLILGTSAREGFHLKSRVYKLGADDFLLRPFPVQEVWFRIEALIRTRRLQRQIDQASRNLSHLNLQLADSNKRLEQMTLTDDLTGLSNMRYMHKFLENHFLVLQRHPRPFAILMMDLDHFKSVNDKNDHLVGSATIRRVGEVIQKVMRLMDVKARYGGDEYIAAMPETDEVGARMAGERLRAAIEITDHTGSDGTLFRVTPSIGLACFDVNRHKSYKDLIRDADCALYEAKRLGRNRVAMYVHGVTERPEEDKLKRV